MATTRAKSKTKAGKTSKPMAKAKAKPQRRRAKVAAPGVGTVAWVDLTVQDADGLRDFYAAVVGWQIDPVEIPAGHGVEAYSDYAMVPPGAKAPVAGVCHARGMNAGIPPVWMVYVMVANLAEAVEKVTRMGGRVLRGPDAKAAQASAIIADPSGAVCTLVQGL